MEITAERHPIKFYLTLIFIGSLLLISGIFFLTLSIHQNSVKFGLLSLFAIGIAASVIIGFIKNAPNIVLNNDGIYFKNNHYPWNELSSFKLTGRGDMVFTSHECATLIFKDNKTLKIYDDFYSNSAELKCYIQQIVIEKKEKTEKTNIEIDSFDLSQETYTAYKGNPIFPFTGIIMWGFIFVFTILPVINSKGNFSFKAYSFLCLLTLSIVLLYSRMYYYFKISKKYIVIKNYYFFWKKDVFSISNIHEIVYKRHNRHSKKVILITNDFKSKSYLVGSLRDKTLLNMKKDLKSKNISVRDECFYEEK